MLKVSDATIAVDWYRRLGFRPLFEHRFEPGAPAYVGLHLEGAEIHLSEHLGDAPSRSLAYLWVPTIEPLAAEFGVAIAEMDWGREIEVTDPDGNRLRIAEARGEE